MTQNSIIKNIIALPAISELIISTIQKRLIEKGTYAYGDAIVTYRAQQENFDFRYAQSTIFGGWDWEGKRYRSGNAGIWEHVTLYDTGEFYKSMVVVPGDGEAMVWGDSSKDDGPISANLDTQEILTLSDAGLAILRAAMLEELQKEMRSYLTKTMAA